MWPTDELFNINSNINIILEDSGRKVVYVRSTPIAICDCDGKVRAIALRLRLRLHGNATASLKISLRLLRLRSPTAPTNYYQSSNWYISSAVMLQHVLQRRSIALCMLYACYTFQSQRNVQRRMLGRAKAGKPGLK